MTGPAYSGGTARGSARPELTDAELNQLVEDADKTEREVGQALLHVTSVAMLASLVTSCIFGYYAYDQSGIGAAEMGLVALTVDYAMYRWLRMSKTLRKQGTITRTGEVLDFLTFAMSLYLNACGGLATLIPPLSPIAYVLLTIGHIFIPIMFYTCHKAMPGAQLLVRENADRGRLERERRQQARLDKSNDEARADQIRRDEVAKAEAGRRTAEATEKTKAHEAQIARANADITIVREKNEAAAHSLSACIAFLSWHSINLTNSQAIQQAADRRARDRVRRQAASSGDRQPPSSGRRQAVVRSDRQAAPSGRRQAPATGEATDDLTIEELTAHALAHLTVTDGMGAVRLREWLTAEFADRLNGGTVSHYKTRETRDAIKARKGSGTVLEFHARAVNDR